jgi:hypothetical protein
MKYILRGTWRIFLSYVREEQEVVVRTPCGGGLE